MKLQKLSSAEDSGILITWSRRAVATGLAWFEMIFKISLTFGIAHFLRWLIGHPS